MKRLFFSIDLLLLLALQFFCTGCSKSNFDNLSFRLGDTPVYVSVYQRGDSQALYFNMHDDENTAVEAAQAIVDEFGGKLIDLRAKGERLISFSLNGEEYTFDPNRIYTPTGIDSTLTRYGKHAPEAHAEIQRFVDSLFEHFSMEQLQLMITVHNNTDQSYSILSYLPDGEYAADADSVYRNPERDIDDFFFVTTPAFFTFFKKHGENVILQDNANVTDDGSLSVYCGNHNIPYLNVEAQHGHLQRQIEMLKLVQRLRAKQISEK